ncbi:MAG TPA: ATP-binding cassette domain-containing protein [Jiangellales bacterium]|nr:ATP-binding cassette domain-containing protein [Jiangellales bacterium]
MTATPATGASPAPAGEAVPVFRFRDAVVGYGDVAVVHADLVVRTGDAVALLGPNGSGKSTLVRGALGLADVLAGSVEVMGTPVGKLRDRWRIGYVPQHHSVGGGLPVTVREIVSTGRLARRHWYVPARAEDREQVDAAIATVGLADKAGSPLTLLSGGQQRRALVARALAARPDVLVLDEPTAGVDQANQEILAQTLARSAADGVTIVMVTHEVGPFAGLLTRAVALRDGRVVSDGPLDPSLPAEREEAHPHAGASMRVHGAEFGLSVREEP